MNKVYLGLGSNIGESKKNIERALSLLSKKTNIINQSSYYKTEPVGFKDQAWFLNMVIEVETELNPMELLDFTQGIEKEMKRVKTRINGPRIIDVDILLYNQEEINSERLTIPHPRMRERAFVMIPMHEIAPEIIIEGTTIEGIIDKLEGEEIEKLGN